MALKSHEILSHFQVLKHFFQSHKTSILPKLPNLYKINITKIRRDMDEYYYIQKNMCVMDLLEKMLWTWLLSTLRHFTEASKA